MSPLDGTPLVQFVTRKAGARTEMLSFFVPGEVVPQGRPRATRAGTGIRMYEPKRSREWKRRIELATAVAMEQAGIKEQILDQPVALQVNAYLKRPQSHFNSKGELRPSAPKHHLGRKDTDNILKLVLDGVIPLIPHDQIVTTVSASKHWAVADASGYGPGVHIRVVRSLQDLTD